MQFSSSLSRSDFFITASHFYLLIYENGRVMFCCFFYLFCPNLWDNADGNLLCIYMSYGCEFHKQILVWGTLPFFRGQNPKAQTLTCTKKDQGNCYMYMWHGTSLMGRCYFRQDPPLFFQGQKNKNFTVAPMGTLCFLMLTLRNPPMEIGKLLGIYIAQVVFTNARVGFCGLSPILQGTKTSILGSGGLLFHNSVEYGKHLTIFTWHLAKQSRSNSTDRGGACSLNLLQQERK